MAKPRKSRSKSKEGGLSVDERVLGTPPLPGQEKLPFDGAAAPDGPEPEKPQVPSLTGTRLTDATPPPPPVEPPRGVGCIRQHICTSVDALCLEAGQTECGLFNRNLPSPTAPGGNPPPPSPTRPSWVPANAIQLPDPSRDGMLTWCVPAPDHSGRFLEILRPRPTRDALDSAAEAREEREGASSAGAIEWNGIAMRRAYR